MHAGALTRDKVEENLNGCEVSECRGLLVLWSISKRRFLKIVQGTMKHDPFDAM